MEEVKTLTTNGGDFVKVRVQRFNVFRVYMQLHSFKAMAQFIVLNRLSFR